VPYAPWGVRHGAELRTISRELRRMDDREVTLRFRRELRAAAAPLVPAVRASITQIPSKQPARGREGLRATMARAVRLEVRTVGRTAGVAIRVDGRRMPPGEGKLPAYMEGTAPRWRHPVYGHPWWIKNNQPAHPYFYRVVTPLGPASRVAVNRAMDGITRDITGGWHSRLAA
jgi:hypothetical protein